MKDIEKYWLNKVLNQSENYELVIEEDCVWVRDSNSLECVFEFSEYGNIFTIDVMPLMGFNVMCD